MTEDEERAFIEAITEWNGYDPQKIIGAIAPLIAKAKRAAWRAGRNAGADHVAEDARKQGVFNNLVISIRALEPPEDL